MARCEAIPGFIEELVGERPAYRFTGLPASTCGMGMNELISLVPDCSFHDCLVLAWMTRSFVTDLADINRLASRVYTAPRENE